MVYQGSKAQLMKYIYPYIEQELNSIDPNKNNILLYIEPFVGGANSIVYVKEKYQNQHPDVRFYGSDINPYLIDLLNYGKKYLIPNYGFTFEDKQNLQLHKEYLRKIVRKELPNHLNLSKWYIGAINLLYTYRGLWDSGLSIDKNPKKSRINQQIKNFNDMNLTNISFINLNHLDALESIMAVSNYENNKYKIVVYLDPPYPGSDQKVYTRSKLFKEFTYCNKFIDLIKSCDLNNVTFILSGLTPPQKLNFKLLWSKEIFNNASHSAKNHTRVENLYILKKE